MRHLLPIALLVAAAPADTLRIGDQVFGHADVLDARAVADGDGAPVIYITFTRAAAARLRAVAAASPDTPLPVSLGSQTLAAPVLADDSATIGGARSFADAAALARRISGKAPLPDSLDE